MTGGSEPLGGRLPELRVPPPGPASRAFAARLRAVESRDVTHLSDTWPVFWEAASGANVRDADGNVYLDLTGAFGVALLGHAEPGVMEAARAQMDRLVHGMGDVHPPAVKVDALERLARLGPWSASRVVLGSSGAEAVEAALKTALVATGRPGVVAFEGAYHGLTLGALAVTHRDYFRGPFASRLYAGVAFAPFPVSGGGRAAVDASLAAVEAALRDGAPNGDPVGAVIVEPVQGRAGVRVPEPGFMEALSALARGHGALVIADEIFTGLGRCGAPLASARVGLEPHLVCVGKALGGGFPLSACLGDAEVMDAWPESRGEAMHTSTFLGHPVACAAACRVLDAVRLEGVPERAEAQGRALADALTHALQRALGGAPPPWELRRMGLLLGLAFPDPGAGARLAQALLGRGILALPAGEEGEVLQMSPPLDLTGEQVAFAAETVVTTTLEVVGA